MATTMQFELVSPERRLATLEAVSVRIPGAEGELTAMPGHVPALTTLRPGLLVALGADGVEARFVVTGGFAEVTGKAVSVLAERSFPVAELTRETVASLLSEARAAVESAPAERLDAAQKYLADLERLAAEVIS